MRVVFWLIFMTHCMIGTAIAVELTSEERTFLQEKGTIVFVSQSNYPPFEFNDPVGLQREGMMLDVVRWLAVELGFQPQFTDMSFLNAQEAVLEGRADVLTSLFHSDQRAEHFAFTQALFNVPASIFVRAERTDITTLADLQGKIIAMQKGDFASEFLKSKGINCTILTTEDFAEATDRVIDGQADAVIGDEQIVLYYLHSHRLGDRIKKVGAPLYTGSNCMAARLDNAQLIAILNKGIAEAKRTGVLDKIGKKWLGPTYGIQETLFTRYGLPIAVLAGMLLVLALTAWGWNLQLRVKVREATGIIRRRELSLRESERNLRTLFDSMADLIFVGDLQGTILHCNKAAAEKLGHSRDELLGMSFSALHPSQLRQEAAAIIMAMAEGKTETCPLPLATRSGHLLPVETRVWYGQWDGSPCLFSLCKDLSKEQEALQRFNRLFSANPAPLALNDAATRRFIEVNDAFLRLTGYRRQQIIGATSMALHLFTNPEKHQQAVDDLTATGRIRDVELQVRCANGELVDSLFSGEVIENQGQQCLLIVMIDQTARKRAEQLLRASENEYRRLFETMIDIFWRLDRQGKISRISPSVTRITGYQPEELLGTDIQTYAVNPKDRYRIVSRIAKNGFVEGIELTVRAKNGAKLRLACSARIERDKNDAFVCIEGIARDITETHEARLALQRELAYRTTIISAVADGLCVFHEIPEHPFVRFTVWNNRMTELTGYTMEAINRSGWCQTLYPDPAVQKRAMARLQSTRQGMDLRAEEWEITRADDVKLTLSISTSFVVTEHGKVHMLAVLRDTTERRRAEGERLRLEKELVEARKQESLARMAGATAHHFNNKLGAALGYLELLQEEQYFHAENRKMLDQVLKALEQAVDLSHFMLQYAGQGRQDRTEVDVSEAVRRAISLVDNAGLPRVDIQTGLGANLPAVTINEDDLQRILDKVIVNAVEAMEGGSGIIRITSGTGFFRERYLRRAAGPPTPPPGRYVFVKVRDHGCGMDGKTLARMFDPFFSTKFVGRGQGLALVDVLVRAIRGGIVVAAKPGRGTAVVLLFPAGPSRSDSAGHGGGGHDGPASPSANGTGTSP